MQQPFDAKLKGKNPLWLRAEGIVMSKIEKLSVADAIAAQHYLDGGLQQDAWTSDRDDDDLVRLLQDILAIFDQRNADRLPTSTLIESLLTVEGQDWSGQYLRDTQKLARLLRPLHIRSKNIRFNDGIAKGFQRRWFEEALKPSSPCKGALG